MIKKIVLALMAVLMGVSVAAQTVPGGVTAKVVNRAGRVPVQGATVTLSRDGQVVSTVTSASDGSFTINSIPDGQYSMKVLAEGFAPAIVNVSVEGFVRDLIFVSLVAEQVISDIDDTSFAEFDMDDSGYSDNPAILYGANDPYNNIVSYGFSDIRFKNRATIPRPRMSCSQASGSTMRSLDIRHIPCGAASMKPCAARRSPTASKITRSGQEATTV